MSDFDINRKFSSSFLNFLLSAVGFSLIPHNADDSVVAFTGLPVRDRRIPLFSMVYCQLLFIIPFSLSWSNKIATSLLLCETKVAPSSHWRSDFKSSVLPLETQNRRFVFAINEIRTICSSVRVHPKESGGGTV